MRPAGLALVLVLAGAGDAALADEADVRAVEASRAADGTYRFEVTVEHADEGWEHYADAFEIVAPDGGTVLATRILLHPHVDEQPFTRSLAGVRIPRGMSAVRVRARDNVHGYGGAEVKLETAAGD